MNANQTQTPAYRDPHLSVEQRVEDLLDQMTLEEKVAQLHGLSNRNLFLSEKGGFSSESARQVCPDGLAYVGRVGLKRAPKDAAILVNAIQKYLIEETRLGIPALILDEALHGFMAHRATSFPQAIALSSTWDTQLVEQVYAVAAAEMRAQGSTYALTPVLDLARDPRWGRTEETYGEDPYLVARMGVAAVQGLQGQSPSIDHRHVLATAKHFAVHGQPAGGTNVAPGNYAERVVREEFLLPFQAAVTEAGVHSVMASYNEINGIPSHINHWLLQDVLRREWGFQGIVTSDGGGIDDLVRLHHVATTRSEAAHKALEAGVDLELGSCFETLARQVHEGKASETTVGTAVARVLHAKFLLGLFENPYADPDEAERITNCFQHQQLALRAAHKAIILLKNENQLLPLDINSTRSIAVIGPNAAQLHLGGYSVDPGRGVSVLEGIRNKVGQRVSVSYAEGCRITTGKQGWEAWWEDPAELSAPVEDIARIAEAVRIAQSADVALVVVGGNENTCREAWAAHHLGDRDDLDLLGSQDELIKAIVDTGTPTIVLLINGRPLSINYAAKHVPAILEGWYLGQETGTAVADVLFGDVNPGGRLPITFPRSVGQLPAYYYHKPSAKRGYLFSNTAPIFPFGHGLSYTTFRYDHLRVLPERITVGESATVQVQVTNTGRRAGDEVVQLYVRDQVSSITRPVKELKGFKRITLRPGETKTAEFALTADHLAFLDANMDWVVEPGTFDVMVGTNSVQVSTIQLEVN
jgi:beta-glucosidase